MTSQLPDVTGVALPWTEESVYLAAEGRRAAPVYLLGTTHVFHIMDVLVSLSVAHHFVEAEFVLSKEDG